MAKGVVNMGIAIVVPISNIAEVINQPMIRKDEDRMVKEHKEKRLPTADSLSEDEEITKEGFDEALRRASRRVATPEPEKGEE